MPSYYFWLSQAQRYQKSVSFASPITAWTPEMLAESIAKSESNTTLECGGMLKSMGDSPICGAAHKS